MSLNFVVVLTDDQGQWAMPDVMPELRMPNLLRLMGESVVLSQFFCASPVCSPARASMLTGRMPSAHGVHDWLIGGRHPEARPDRYLEGQPTTGEALSRAGYQCAMVGKWHVGDSRFPAPGYEYWWAHRYGGGSYWNAPIWRDGHEAEEPRYLTHAITDEALAFLDARDPDRPFYMQVNYTAPHDPWDAGEHPKEYLDLYAECEFASVPRDARHPWTLSRNDFDSAFRDPLPSLRGYCAALTAVDDGLGRILAAIEDYGIADETVVIYTSDNGFSCGHHGIWGKGNGTYPLNFFDNSVRVPCVVHLPGGLIGIRDELVQSTGLHATICELAGVTPDPDEWSASSSFTDVLRDPDASGAGVVVVHSEYGGGRMIFDGQWKLVLRFDGPTELYDLESDPGEEHNLAADDAYAPRVRSMTAQMEQWFAEHERPGASGWAQPVTGRGQIHPPWRGRGGHDSYQQGVNGDSLDR